jgi:cell division protease FtsH
MSLHKSNADNRKYPLSTPRFMEMMRKLNRINQTEDEYFLKRIEENQENVKIMEEKIRQNRAKYLNAFGIRIEIDGINPDVTGEENDDNNDDNNRSHNYAEKKSQNFEVVKKSDICFNNVGGYDTVKMELKQCADILKNYKKYKKFNVRVPKGLILEGPPGTGKTMLAKAFASESNCSFIALSGSDFQEKYVGIGPSRIKELFKLARKNIPCVVFIDEIDAVGKKRSSDGETSSSERDNTLNALLVELDGFKNNSGVFLIAATNRIDLLDNALLRPGRIDKKIFMGLPDKTTRKEIIKIHMNGKPYDNTVCLDNVLEITDGFSGAQIENMLNEAMLNALKHDKNHFSEKDLELIVNKMIAGWQPTEHEFTSDAIDRIAIHEMGHAVTGYLTEFHANITKVVINLFSPKSPGYTVFQNSISALHTRESLFEHLMILLSGRIAEEIFYGMSVTTGAMNDLEEALLLAEKMVVYFGMGSSLIYPNKSEKYRELIDDDVRNLLNEAYDYAELILLKHKEIIQEGAIMLKKNKILTVDNLENLMNEKIICLMDSNDNSFATNKNIV